MGNAASKEESVEPPPEWDPTSNAQQYVVESPMSDVSDPSMFLHLRPHPKLSDATVQQIAGNKKKTKSGKEPPAHKLSAEQRKGVTAPPPRAARQTPAGERRRRSKVITRDSAYKHESRPRELAPPSSFYFPNVPTRESEENLNRLSVRKSSSTGARRQSNTTKSNEDGMEQQDQQDNKENAVRKNTPLLKKAKRKVNRATSCLTGCFEESTHNIQLMKDNAKPETKRGQRLPSEGFGKESLLKVEEEPFLEEEQEFDPYQENPLQKTKSTAVLQFVDGAEKELAFNPVWRESHDGTYHSDPSSMAESSRRASDFALSKRTSRDSTRRASDPSSQARNKSYPTKKDKAFDDDRNTKSDQMPFPPGEDLFERSKQERGSINSTKEASKPRKSTGSTNGSSSNSNSDVGSDSVATSHESTYWNDFYKDAQILHHEDSYFDRIAFVPNKSSAPEPSPMANHSAVTPIVALFGQDRPKSLLGSMDRGDDMDDMDPNCYSSDSFINKEGDGTEFTNRSSKRNSKVSRGSHDERDVASLSRTSRAEAKKLPVQEKENSATPVTSDDTNSKNRRGSSGGARALVVVSEPVGNEALDKEKPEGAIVPFDEENDENLGKPPKESFLDNRITADRILVQTSLVRRGPKNHAPKRDTIDIKAALQATPKNAVVEHRTSIGSAFSYKDRDVFTPVTSLTTYPKGSPFRPRVAVNEMAMAKAELDRPVLLEKPAMHTQSCDNMSRSSSRDMTIQACESAPSMIESHDYRDIALGCFRGDTPTNTANKQERALTLFSPGVMSIESPMSTAMSPAQPLLSNQVVNNAAFLFSPSYASGMSLTSGSASIGPSDEEKSLQQSKRLVAKTKSKGNSFSISTLGSRSRLSGRSKMSIRIPFSSSGSLPPIKGKKGGSRKSSISDDGSRQSRQKSVRFSDGQSVAEQSESASQKSRRSVTWDFSFKTAPENVDIPAIETKVSDLSDTVFSRDPSPGGSTTKRDSIESAKSKSSSGRRESTIKEEEETASLTSSEAFSRHSRSAGSTSVSQEPISRTGTPEQGTKTWTYNEFSRGVTPLLDKKQLAQAGTNSPVLRFKAAKNKFVGTHTHEKEVPVKKSPSFHKRKAGTGRVHLLASKFDNGGHALEPPVTMTSFSRDYSTAEVDRPTNATAPQGERPKMLRTPQIIGYAPKSYPNIYQRASMGSHGSSIKPVSSWGAQTMQTRTMSTDDSEAALSTVVNEIPEEDSDADDASQQSSECSDDDTFVQSVATLRQDRHTQGQTTNVIPADTEDDHLDDVLDEILQAESTDSQDSSASSARGTYSSGGDVPCDEAADDFAELLLNNILSAPSQDESTVATASQNHRTLKGMRSGSWQDEEENSTFTNILSAPTFSDESTTMSAMMATQKPANLRHGAQTVKPQPHPNVQQLHNNQSVPSHALHLSPNMRTANQVSKWRELAARAQKNDDKKSIFRPGTGKKTNKKSLLSERNTNIAC